MGTDTALFEKAARYAFLLLKYRQRSAEEMRQRLRRKRFQASVIERVIGFLTAKRFLDDEAFARAWVASRIAQSVGTRRIARELARKGIAPRTIEGCLRDLPGDYSEEKTVEELARRRLDRLRGLDPQAARRRVYGYLVRRGFSADEIVDALNRLEQ